MDNKKRIVNLEYFREMLHICLRLHGQTFDKLSFEEEILAFLRFLGHNEEIKKLTDVNINKLHQSWRSFAAIINKCLSGKSTGYDSLRKTSYIKLSIRMPRRAMRCTISDEVSREKKPAANSYLQASGFGVDKGTDDDDEVDERSDDQDYNDDQDDEDQDDNDDDQDDDDDFVHPKLSIYEEEAKVEESFDPIV
nr:hypothetical protein [Tanacetum cinerariifolium]